MKLFVSDTVTIRSIAFEFLSNSSYLVERSSAFRGGIVPYTCRFH